MAVQDFLLTYLIVIVVGGVFLIAVIILLGIIYNLCKKVNRLEYQLKLMNSDKRMMANPADMNRMERQRAIKKYKSLRANKDNNFDIDDDMMLESNKRHHPKYNLETHEEDHNMTRRQQHDHDDVEAQNLNRRGIDRVNFYNENPLSPDKRRNSNKPVSQIYRSHSNRYPVQKANSYMQASIRSPGVSSYHNGDHHNQEQDEDDTLGETSATNNDNHMDDDHDMMEDSIAGSEEIAINIDVHSEPPYVGFNPPTPLRSTSQHYKLSIDDDDDDSVAGSDIYAQHHMKGSSSYFQSFMSPSEYQHLTSHLKTLSLPQLQHSIQELMEKNDHHRKQSKLPPRMVAPRIQDALLYTSSSSSAAAVLKDESTAVGVLQRYGEMLAAENEKFARRLKSSSGASNAPTTARPV